MKDNLFNNFPIDIFHQWTKVDACKYVIDLLNQWNNLNNPVIDEALSTLHDFLLGKISVSHARKIAFEIHDVARETHDLNMKNLYRACGHAVATIHVKEHAMKCYDYLLKVSL